MLQFQGLPKVDRSDSLKTDLAIQDWVLDYTLNKYEGGKLITLSKGKRRQPTQNK